MQYHLRVFETEDHFKVRTFTIDDAPWFALADSCDALDLKPHRRSYAGHAEKLDDDEKRRVSPAFAAGMPGSDPGIYEGPQPVMLISESGLYTLILRSDKPGAKRFKKWITSEVLPTIRKTGSYSLGRGTPAFIKRFNENWDRVDAGHFSILSETVTRIFGRFEMAGHIIADKAPDGTENRLDVAVGRRFSDWLKANHPGQKDNFTYYMHTTPQWEGLVRQYPNTMLPLFIEFIEDVWLPRYAQAYISPRDPAALPYQDKIIPALDKPRAGMVRAPRFPTPALRRG
ncbi:BRO-N domain-containing protein [Xanthobacter flavus]|uniref:BRO-N domain-containing protein n=1 Tax=Xanthobacter flavus TaxID=281 RepID=UPI00372ADBCA